MSWFCGCEGAFVGEKENLKPGKLTFWEILRKFA